tara:strand:- start:680 stop:1339 length:660 start_codon:yes stop_codon:yes gene_type:complete
MNIAIIPARGGSKRIKKKNIKIFYGKPIIFYPLKILIKSRLFKIIYVTSDDDEILDYVKRKFPKVKIIKREKKFSTDKVKTLTVIKNLLKKLNNNKIKKICCVYPATPFLNEKNLKLGLVICKKYKNFVFPVAKSNFKNGKFFELKKNSINKIIFSNKSKLIRYQDTGQFYWGTLKNWLEKKSIIDKSSKCFVLKDNEAIDINTYDDWNKAEKFYKRKK